ncbi:DUF2793 domain-containing protein [Blastomonas fulva]|jgi:hypothetical protein|uniref:DUF2793 domain-containing protein n=1 Tax=Blastomonas fulva TaxID=1550728 RepID=UPI003D2C1F5F
MLAAQAQKELTHNEALVVIDALLGGCIEGIASDPGTVDAEEVRAWVVGPSPAGAWADRESHIAISTAGGWRFAPPLAGMRIFDRADGVMRRFDGGEWFGAEAIADPAGGAVVDAEARIALTALLAALREFGLVGAT